MIKWRGVVWSVHPLFVILMIGAVMTGYFLELFTLFAIVLVHELGHVAAARYFGWTVREVKLLPFGGVAEVEEAGGVPAKEEALVALAGPLQNVWLGFVAWGLGATGIWDEQWSEYVWRANAMIGLFNLLPVYPLDGGKLLQAALSYMITYYKAMLWTMRVSMLLSLLIVVAAVVPALLYGHGVQLNFLIIGCFLLASNWTYYRNIPYLFFRFLMYRDRVAEKAVKSGETARSIIVGSKQTIMSVARLLKRENYHLIYLLEPGGYSMKMIPEQEIVRDCLSGRNPYRAVEELFS